MNIFKLYHSFLNKISKTSIIILLTGLIILINLVIFPTSKIQEVKLLDTRFYYSAEEASEYVLLLDQNEKIKSQIMHGTVDIIYPVIYTLLFSSIIIALKGGWILTAIPLLALTADILENIFIIIILIIPQQNILFTIGTVAASVMTPFKWCFILLSICAIIYQIIRRIHEK